MFKNQFGIVSLTFCALVVLAIMFASAPERLPADVLERFPGYRAANVSVGKIDGAAITATASTSMANSDTHYTDGIEVGDVEDLAVIVRPSAIGSGGTLTMTLQSGVLVDGVYVWSDYQQLTATDKVPYATGTALQYQPQYVSYALAAANIATKCYRFDGWKPAKYVRLKMGTSAHPAIVTGVWFLTR